MNATQTEEQKHYIQRVGRTGSAWLQRRGNILIYQSHSWVSSTSTFLPVEALQISEGRRRDIRRLWLGLLALLTAILLSLPLFLLLRLWQGTVSEFALAAPLGVLCAFALVCGVGALIAWLLPRDYVRIDVAGLSSALAIVFWRERGAAPELDALIEGLKADSAPDETARELPVRMHHMWRRPRQYRMALVQSGFIAAILYILLLLVDFAHQAGYFPGFTRWSYLVLLAPPLFYLALAHGRTAALRAGPAIYNRAVRCYGQGNLERAEEALNRLLEETPDHHRGRFLLIQIYSEQFRFDEAEAHCVRLRGEHPLVAARMQSNIQSLRRMHARMHEAPGAPRQ